MHAETLIYGRVTSSLLKTTLNVVVLITIRHFRLLGHSVSFVALFVCLSMTYRLQFKSNLHQSSHTGKYRSWEKLMIFRRSWSQRSRSSRKISAADTLRYTVTLMVKVTALNSQVSPW